MCTKEQKIKAFEVFNNPKLKDRDRAVIDAARTLSEDPDSVVPARIPIIVNGIDTSIIIHGGVVIEGECRKALVVNHTTDSRP